MRLGGVNIDKALTDHREQNVTHETAWTNPGSTGTTYIRAN